MTQNLSNQNRLVFSALLGMLFSASANAITAQTDDADLLLSLQAGAALKSELTNLMDDVTNTFATPHFVIYDVSFTNASSQDRSGCDCGQYPTNINSLITNTMLGQYLLDPESARFYFSDGDDGSYIGTPFKFCYRWDGNLRAGYMTLYYVNAKNALGGYTGKKLYGYLTSTKQAEAIHSVFRCEFFEKVRWKNENRGAILIAYPPNYDALKIKNPDYGFPPGPLEINLDSTNKSQKH